MENTPTIQPEINIIWKTIENYPSYEVSNDGNIRNKKNGKILKQSTSTAGYKTVTLCNNGNVNCTSVHKIVLETFKPTEHMNKLAINHIDMNKTNNNISNLEWISKSDLRSRIKNTKEIHELERLITTAVSNILYKYFDIENTAITTKNNNHFNDKNNIEVRCQQ